MKLKHACVDAGQYGLNFPASDYASSGVRLIRTSDLSDRGLSDASEGIFVPGPVENRFLLQENDLLLSRSGTVGRSYLAPVGASGSTFAGFLVRFRALTSTEPRFLSYVAESTPFQSTITSDAVVSTIQNFNADKYANIEIPDADLEDQRRIADFLDDQVSRIDNIIAARHEQISRLSDEFNSSVLASVRGEKIAGARKYSGLRWLGSVPVAWPMLTVQSQFEVLLGRMLDEKRETGVHGMLYLRNTNVQWDVIDTDDLKSMDIQPFEFERFTVRPGDLLICEGGQPGRAAIWDGRIQPIAYQKALHRARSRGESDPLWLLNCLRAAVSMNAFAIENGQTTIGHLTNEQLREQKLPFPERATQKAVLSQVVAAEIRKSAGESLLNRQVRLLTEYKQSLITAAVTGELDVTTASKTIPA